MHGSVQILRQRFAVQNELKKAIQPQETKLANCGSGSRAGTPEFFNTAPRTFREFTLIPTSCRCSARRTPDSHSEGFLVASGMRRGSLAAVLRRDSHLHPHARGDGCKWYGVVGFPASGFRL